MAGFSVRMHGADQLDALARRLRAAGRTDLERELRRELRKPPKQLERAVKQGLPAFLPDRYARALSPSLRFRTTIGRGAVVRVTVTMHGRGRGADRAVVAVNRGVLRHPVYGRRRRTTRGRVFTNPWAEQKVHPGFWSDPVAVVGRQVQADTVAAIDRVAAKIAKG